jgi:hypothetical protein
MCLSRERTVRSLLRIVTGLRDTFERFVAALRAATPHSQFANVTQIKSGTVLSGQCPGQPSLPDSSRGHYSVLLREFQVESVVRCRRGGTSWSDVGGRAVVRMASSSSFIGLTRRLLWRLPIVAVVSLVPQPSGVLFWEPIAGRRRSSKRSGRRFALTVSRCRYGPLPLVDSYPLYVSAYLCRFVTSQVRVPS